MISKDQVYLNIAKEAAKLSKDKNTQVGCVIVDKNGIVVSTGRNGTVSGFDDKKIPLSREKQKLNYYEGDLKVEFEENKYPFVLHSEENAILFADNRSRLIDATIYVTGIPCPHCALLIAQTKICKVVIPKDYDTIAMMDEHKKNLTKYIFLQANIELYVEDEFQNLNNGPYFY